MRKFIDNQWFEQSKFMIKVDKIPKKLLKLKISLARSSDANKLTLSFCKPLSLLTKRNL